MDDFIYRLGQLYQQMLSRRRNEDYRINPVQMDRFLELLRFFRRKADPEFDLGIEPFHLEAKEECGGFSANFCVFDLCGNEVREFARLISCCSAVSIDARTDSQVCISLTVPDLFVPRADKEGPEDPEDFDMSDDGEEEE